MEKIVSLAHLDVEGFQGSGIVIVAFAHLVLVFSRFTGDPRRSQRLDGLDRPRQIGDRPHVPVGRRGVARRDLLGDQPRLGRLDEGPQGHHAALTPVVRGPWAVLISRHAQTIADQRMRACSGGLVSTSR